MQLQKLPSIWTESSATMGFPRYGLSMDKSKRFEYNSIYYKDDPTRPKKKVDEFMFPHDLLARFRKSIKEASTSKSREKKGRPARRNRSAFDEEEDRPDGVQPRANKITNKLYQKPLVLAQERDCFGNRSSLHEKELVEHYRLPHCSATRNNSHQKIYVTAAQRMDLSRPNNFNPGPGAYLLSSVELKRGLNSSMQSDEGILKRKTREKMLKSLEMTQSLHH